MNSGINAQQIYVDQPYEVGDLIVFPHITDTTKYYYLPNKIQMGENNNGGPRI